MIFYIEKSYKNVIIGKENYKSFIEINYVSMPEFSNIFQDGYTTDKVIKNMSLLNSNLQFIPGETLFFFDEMQEFPDTATSLNFFHEDGRFDVICSGSLMGINYNQIHSNSVGNKEDYTIRFLDEESQKDLRNNQNFGTYKGTLYENIVTDMLVKAGFDLFFYRDEQNKIEMDFILRKDS